MKRWRIAGINFDHFHMGDLLRQTAEHPNAEIVAICDEHPERMTEAARNFSLRPDQVFTDTRACLEQAKPDIVVLVTGDGDFAYLAGKLRRRGIRVEAAALPSTLSAELKRAVHQVIDLRDFFEEEGEGDRRAKPAADGEDGDDWDDDWDDEEGDEAPR